MLTKPKAVKPQIYLPVTKREVPIIIDLDKPEGKESTEYISYDKDRVQAIEDHMEMSGSLIMTYEKQRDEIRANMLKNKSGHSIEMKEDFVIRIEDVSSRIGYENLLSRMKNRKDVRKLVISRLKNKFLSQQCKEIELCSRKWPALESVKIEGTSLEDQHARTFARMFINKKTKIKTISLNFNGMNEERFYQLFVKRNIVSDMPNLRRLSIKNNPNIRPHLVEKVKKQGSKSLTVDFHPDSNKR